MTGEVHFVTAREPRARSLSAVIKDAQKDQAISRDFLILASERQAFSARLIADLGLKPDAAEPAKKAPSRTYLDTKERRLTVNFYNLALKSIRATRELIRAHNASTGQALAVPEYPDNVNEMYELATRLGKK